MQDEARKAVEDREEIRRLKEDVADLEAEMQEKDRLVEEKDEAMVTQQTCVKAPC